MIRAGKPACTYAIAESAAIATAVRPPKIGSNINMTSRANFFLSIAVMISSSPGNDV